MCELLKVEHRERRQSTQKRGHLAKPHRTCCFSWEPKFSRREKLHYSQNYRGNKSEKNGFGSPQVCGFAEKYQKKKKKKNNKSP